MDTIFSLATVRGKSGVAVLRISGPEAFRIARCLVGSLPEERRASLRIVRGPDGGTVDQALVLRFSSPDSFTGEDVVEFHLHGSLAAISKTENLIADTGLARQAEAGEFTRRALENDRLDVAQVEGLADLLAAETEAQRKQAVRLLEGHLGAAASRWRDQLLQAAALIEAGIDFADEEVPEDVGRRAGGLLQDVRQALEHEIRGSHVAERVRAGFEVAILGPPNIGKSTLLNMIARRDVAITSDIAGTTRDVLEVPLDLGGLPVTLLDTAGLREATDQIERIGIERTQKRGTSADLRVYLLEEKDEPLPDWIEDDDLVIQGKADLKGSGISGLTGEGVDQLLDDIQARLERRIERVATSTNRRHRAAMETAVEALVMAEKSLKESPETPEISAEHLRSALVALDSLTGRIDVEAILGQIFSSFCIGK